MLTASILAQEATGLKNIPVASSPVPFFNGGTPASTLRELVTTIVAPVVRHGGMGYDAAGAACIDTAGAIAVYAQGGMPVTVAGALCVDVNVAATAFNAGIPFTATGRVALATASSILNLSGFDSGFDAGFG